MTYRKWTADRRARSRLLDLQDQRRRMTMRKPHRCNWPTCERQVRAGLWGCDEHWNALPPGLRMWIRESFARREDVGPDDRWYQLRTMVEAAYMAAST